MMFISRISHTFFLLLVSSIVFVGCDNNGGNESQPDAERFLGKWAVIAAADQDGARDQTTVFSGLGVLTVDLLQDGSYSLLLQYTDPATPDLTLTGPYTVNEVGKDLILTVDFQGLTVNLPFKYEFVDDSNVKLTVDGPTLALLLGAPLEGNVVLTIRKTP